MLKFHNIPIPLCTLALLVSPLSFAKEQVAEETINIDDGYSRTVTVDRETGEVEYNYIDSKGKVLSQKQFENKIKGNSNDERTTTLFGKSLTEWMDSSQDSDTVSVVVKLSRKGEKKAKFEPFNSDEVDEFTHKNKKEKIVKENRKNRREHREIAIRKIINASNKLNKSTIAILSDAAALESFRGAGLAVVSLSRVDLIDIKNNGDEFIQSVSLSLLDSKKSTLLQHYHQAM